jgi:L-ascorbate metabolism protein UlaG (beta-lactamase superfamily)
MITSILLLSLTLVFPATYFYAKRNPQFGSRPQKKDVLRYSRSPQWKDGQFLNSSVTTMDVNLWSMPGLLREFIKGRRRRVPVSPLLVQRLNTKDFAEGSEPKFVWYGHSVVLFRVGGRNILVDPMFGDDASPIGPMRTRRFSENTLGLIDSLPDLDLVLLTHDHYDHLDYESIVRIKEKTKAFWVALGTARHLLRWGVPQGMITEFDWWEEKELNELRIIFTPSRHFSGRGLFDRAKSLWGGWVILSDEIRIYWSGDGGYDDHFKRIGQKYGPFDWGFIECGQYNERWHQIHLLPEEAIRAARDSRVSLAIPVHWAAFSLSLHPWDEPAERFSESASREDQSASYPRLGRVVRQGMEPTEHWWRS